MKALLIGYDLYKFIDGSHLAPPTTITINNVVSLNPEYQTWFRQDKLIFSALVESLTSSLIPLISQSHTSSDAWRVLSNTYAKPSRGHIKQIKQQIKNTNKGTKSISKYMKLIKACTDELASLGKPMDYEDLIKKILDDLGDDCQSVIDVVNGRETPISFDELHEKLINKELSLQHQ